ncbi:MAG: hypothetical protein KBA31_00205 [Alphaproteobacteria bacterium]|nr:hypothetical protein [Alphaproteobacteria bacterium]
MSKRRKSLRDRLEAAIERAIALLDQLDGDADLEPSLGSRSCVGSTLSPLGIDPAQYDQRRWATGSTDDREDEHDGHEPDDDSEHFAQPPVMPLVHFDGLRNRWSQDERIIRKA